jgi:predicted outer membrane repeat protein
MPPIMRLALASLLPLVTWCEPASADDAVVGSGTPGSCTEASFDTALARVIPGIQAPGGVLTFNCGNAPHTITFSSQKFLSDLVVIDGGGHITLSGQNGTRLFQIALNGPVGEARTDVALINIALRDGFAATAFGGAVLQLANTSLVLENISIENSRAGLTGGGLACEPLTTVTVRNSVFADNNAQSGAAIACSGSLTVDDSVFQGNSALVPTEGDWQGGAIQSWGAPLIVRRSQFRSNLAGFGGAIFKRDQGLTISDSRFENNGAIVSGGAVASTGSSTLIERSQFSNNVALSDDGAAGGGALLHTAGGTCLIADSSFASNASPIGTTMRMDRGCELRQVTLLSTDPDPPFALTSAAALTFNASTVIAEGRSLFLVSNQDVYQLTITDSIVSGECGPRIIVGSNGGNAFVGSCTRGNPNDLTLANQAELQLDIMRDNGGPVLTMLPLPGSPLIDRIGTGCLFPLDPRGLARPSDGDGDGSARCDSGAAERQRIELSTLFADGFE